MPSPAQIFCHKSSEGMSFNINNGELKSAKFTKFCVSRGIKTHWTAPSTSVQNGCVERFHYTQFNSAWTMWAASKLPSNQWDKFILTATYFCMHIATKMLHNITPYEAYRCHKSNISHLCEIGCWAFVLVLNKHNPKIFQCSEEHVLIGYGKDSKIYWCYHQATHKVVESYHVTFIKSKDKYEVSFRLGVIQGLEDESNNPPSPAPNQILIAPDPLPVVFCMGNPWVILAVPIPVSQVWVSLQVSLFGTHTQPIPIPAVGNLQVCPNLSNTSNNIIVK